ncbi:MAG: ABC transporter ATP-binding protein [Chloroflexi bacterium]|nr:MAG: ABC transporter ATP-binding protein [Chloroflexota bacterium]MBL1192791.1 ABC transporter ATP-binding protein [Chloroflexota bacterium]NOH10085.1 ABC transporter ATP-binding protein [Chloroflexota bacterium]
MIETKDLTKRFGTFTAVDNINLKLEPGEIYGLLGPNGAGKTTTISMILGTLVPTKGEIFVFGQTLSSDPFAIKRRIGVVAESQAFYREMTAWEYLMFFAELYQAEEAEPRAEELLSAVELWDWRNGLIGQFSAGMRRKLGFVRGLIHSPEALILDEPVANLDPYGILQIRKILQAERDLGRTILISSHILSEVEQTVDRVGIISKGRLIIEDNMHNLRQLVGGRRRIEVELVELPNSLVRHLEALDFISEVIQDKSNLTVYTSEDRDYRSDLGTALSQQGAIVQGMRAHEASLEEAFITITEQHIREWAGEREHDDN